MSSWFSLWGTSEEKGQQTKEEENAEGKERAEDPPPYVNNSGPNNFAVTSKDSSLGGGWHFVESEGNSDQLRKEALLHDPSIRATLLGGISKEKPAEKKSSGFSEEYEALDRSVCTLSISQEINPVGVVTLDHTFPEINKQNYADFNYDCSFERDFLARLADEQAERQKREQELQQQFSHHQDLAFAQWVEQQATHLENKRKSSSPPTSSEGNKKLPAVRDPPLGTPAADSTNQLGVSTPLVDLNFEATVTPPISSVSTIVPPTQTLTTPNVTQLPMPTPIPNEPPPPYPGAKLVAGAGNVTIEDFKRRFPVIATHKQEQIFLELLNRGFNSEVIAEALSAFTEDEQDDIHKFVWNFHKLLEPRRYTQTRIKEALVLNDNNLNQAQHYLEQTEKILKDGFTGQQLHDALDLFNHSPTDTVSFLYAFRSLKEFGFPDLKIKEALLLCNNNREKAAKYLEEEARVNVK